MIREGLSPKTAIYAGSFCPPTNGHIDIIERGAALYERVIVAVMVNEKKQYLLSSDQRVVMLRRALSHLKNVEVIYDGGLLVDVAARNGAGVILRGVRGTADLEYEMQLAIANRKISGIETVFLPSAPEVSYLSSSIVNACAMHGGDISGMVPACIMADIYRAHGKE